MDWNREIIKDPMPAWTIVLFSILSGCFFCWLASTDPHIERSASHTVLAFTIGASAYFYLWFLARLAKSPSPWLRRNMKLIVTVGGLLNAIVIIWSMLSKR
jgi:uncharacterized membrane protein YdcZ (DUF606 family)